MSTPFLLVCTIVIHFLLSVKGHITAVCTSTSPTIPNRVVFWFSTYSHGSSSITPNWRLWSGTLQIRDVSGLQQGFTSFSGCDLVSPQTRPTTPAALASGIRASCTNVQAGGRPVLDASSKFVCYIRNPDSSSSSTDPIHALGKTNVNDNTGVTYNLGAVLPNTEWGALAIDGVQAGTYEVLAKQNDFAEPFSACFTGASMFATEPEKKACSLGFTQYPSPATTTFMYNLGSPAGGVNCVDPPSGSILDGTVSDANRDTFCTNVPDGFMCPVRCVSGKSRINNLYCNNGTWSSLFKCTTSISTCALPNSINTPNFSGDPNRPDGVFPTSSSPSCGYISENGAQCRFSCTTSWGYGMLQCSSGTWNPIGNAGCRLASEDQPTSAPTITSLVDEGSGLLRISWQAPDNVDDRSVIRAYEFSVEPAGSLRCETLYFRSDPPPEGYLCTGGAPLDPYKYKIQIRAVNGKSSDLFSSWSAAAQIPCPEPQYNASYTSDCTGVLSGGTCQVSCSPDGTPSANFTCALGTIWSSNVYPTCYTPEQKCPAPAVANALTPSCHEGGIILPNRICTAQCQTGYSPSLASLTCDFGTLIPASFTCAEDPCAAPQGIQFSPLNSCAEGAIINHGDSCTPLCDAGYLPSVPFLNCSLGILHPAQFTCYEAPCSVPGNIANAASQPCVGGALINHSGVCDAQCLPGYEPFPASLNCSLGVLSPAVFSCSEASCAVPTGIHHAAYPPCTSGVSIGHDTSCQAQCIQGYVPIPPLLNCSFGVLSPNAFTCMESPCSSPTGIAHASHDSCAEGAEVPHNSTCQTRCVTGYTPSVFALNCARGVLSPADFTCSESPCTLPVGLANLAPTGCGGLASLAHAQSCALQCQVGYAPSVSSVSCSFGVTSPSTFFCFEAPCVVPTSIPHAASEPCSNGSSVLHGEACEARCSTGYLPSVALLQCSMGSLTPSTFDCYEAPCVAPVAIAHATDPSCSNGTSLSHNSFCEASCQSGYKPSVEMLHCQLGQLTPAFFTCLERGCQAPTGIAHTGVETCSNGTSIPHGVACDTLCAAGYQPVPDLLHCNLGMLTPATFSCTESPCSAPDGIPHAAHPCTSGSIHHGETCQSQCDSGYVPSVSHLNCSTGVLSPSTFHCLEAPCTSPSGIPHAAAQACKNGMDTIHGGVCETQCSAGWVPSTDFLHCSLGVLSPAAFSCTEAPCQAPTGIANSGARTCSNGANVSHGENCLAQCAAGYGPSTAVLACSFGSLSPPNFTCTELPCAAPSGNIAYALSQRCSVGATVQSGGNCEGQCSSGYRAVPSTLDCNLGTLSPSTFTCAPKPCLPPSGIEHATTPSCQNGSHTPHGDVCSPQCETGYVPSLTSLQCSFGVLSPSVFSCLQAPCPPPQGVEHATADPCGTMGASVHHSEQCNTQCAQGYVPGISALNCTLGELQPATFQCYGAPCSAPSGIEHAPTQTCDQGFSIGHQDACSPRCMSGYGPNVSSLNCHLGILSPATLQCVELPCAAPTGIQHAEATSCTEGASVSHGQACSAQCSNGYLPSVQLLNCSFGILEPADFTCAPSVCEISVELKLRVTTPEQFTSSSNNQNSPIILALQEGLASAVPGVQASWVFILGIRSAARLLESSRALSTGWVIVDYRIDLPQNQVANSQTIATNVNTAGVGIKNSINTALSARQVVVQVDVAQIQRSELSLVKTTEVSCSAPWGVENSAPSRCRDGVTIPHEGQCHGECITGYSAYPKVLTCSGGILNPPDFRCFPSSCVAPATVTNAAATVCTEGNTDVAHLGSCTPKCADGYMPSVSSSLVCSFGVLTPPTFYCDIFNDTDVNVTQPPSLLLPVGNALDTGTQRTASAAIFPFIVVAVVVSGITYYKFRLQPVEEIQPAEVSDGSDVDEIDIQKKLKDTGLQRKAANLVLQDENWQQATTPSIYHSPPTGCKMMEFETPSPTSQGRGAPGYATPQPHMAPPQSPAHWQCTCGRIYSEEVPICRLCTSQRPPLQVAGGNMPSPLRLAGLPGITESEHGLCSAPIQHDHLAFHPSAHHPCVPTGHACPPKAAAPKRAPRGVGDGGMTRDELPQFYSESNTADDANIDSEEEDDPDLFFFFFQHLADEDAATSQRQPPRGDGDYAENLSEVHGHPDGQELNPYAFPQGGNF